MMRGVVALFVSWFALYHMPCGGGLAIRKRYLQSGSRTDIRAHEARAQAQRSGVSSVSTVQHVSPQRGGNFKPISSMSSLRYVRGFNRSLK